jgi:hypothetical protein
MYKIYTLPSPTNEVTFTFINIPTGKNWYPEIDHETFNFETDGSTIDINDSSQDVSYIEPFFSNFNINTTNAYILNGDSLTLYTNNSISGQLYIGIY